MKPLTQRERRLVAIGLLVAAFALAYLGIIQPLVAGFTERAEHREELARRYSQNERLIGQISTLRRAAEEQRRLQAVFVQSAPNTIQASELFKERLGAALTKAGGELRGTESTDAAGGWLHASATAQISNDQLVKSLVSLTGEQPYLVIDALTIIADRALNSGRLDQLDVKIEASIPFDQTNAR